MSIGRIPADAIVPNTPIHRNAAGNVQKAGQAVNEMVAIVSEQILDHVAAERGDSKKTIPSKSSSGVTRPATDGVDIVVGG